MYVFPRAGSPTVTIRVGQFVMQTEKETEGDREREEERERKRVGHK